MSGSTAPTPFAKRAWETEVDPGDGPDHQKPRRPESAHPVELANDPPPSPADVQRQRVGPARNARPPEDESGQDHDNQACRGHPADDVAGGTHQQIGVQVVQALYPAVSGQLAQHASGARVQEHGPEFAVPGDVSQKAVPAGRRIVEAGEPVPRVLSAQLVGDDRRIGERSACRGPAEELWVGARLQLRAIHQYGAAQPHQQRVTAHHEARPQMELKDHSSSDTGLRAMEPRHAGLRL